MYSCDELFMRSLECYFGVYFPRCCATREITPKQHSRERINSSPREYIHYSIYVYKGNPEAGKILSLYWDADQAVSVNIFHTKLLNLIPPLWSWYDNYTWKFKLPLWFSVNQLNNLILNTNYISLIASEPPPPPPPFLCIYLHMCI